MSNAREVAQKYIDLTLSVVPLRPGTKEPYHTDWNDRAYQAEDFREDDGIGIKSRDDLVVLDLDNRWAIQLADRFFPATGLVWGRDSRPRAKRAYLCADLEKSFSIQDTLGKEILGVHVNHQDAAPPSIHPSGEELQWHQLGAPALVDRKPLKRACRLLSTAVLIGEHYNHGGSRHFWMLALAGTLKFLGLKKDEAILVVRTAAEIAGDKKVEDRLQEVASTFENRGPVTGSKHLKELSTSHTRSTKRIDPDAFVSALEKIWNRKGVPSIVARTTDITRMIDDAVAALRFDERVYNHGRRLVLISRDGTPEEKWVERAPGAPIIATVAPAFLVEILDQSSQWLKHTDDGYKRTSVPGSVVSHINGRPEWDLPFLEGLIESPTLRRDGSVLDSPGYDPATGLYFAALPGERWLPIPDTVSKASADSAIQELLDPVVDFPFRNDTDRGAYLAAVLSIVCRHLIDGPVPMFSIGAPAPGTGKSLLAKIISIIGTGHEAAVMDYTTDQDEFRKRSMAIAAAGDPVTLLDNLSGSIGSDGLARVLTARVLKDRLLGRNDRDLVLPIRTVWIATGNNITYKKTLGRRVIPIDLDAKVERPEDRSEFKHKNVVGHVFESRKQLLAAALTAMKGFIQAGRPAHGKEDRMGSFEEWDDLIRSAVAWAYGHDPADISSEDAARGRIRATADDDNETLSPLLRAIRSYWKGDPWKVEDIFQVYVDQFKEREEGYRPHVTEIEIREAVRDFATDPRSGKVTKEALRYGLREAIDKISDGLVLRRGPKKRVRTFRVETIEGEKGEGAAPSPSCTITSRGPEGVVSDSPPSGVWVHSDGSDGADGDHGAAGGDDELPF